MAECCGQERDGNFCLMCGNSLADGKRPIDELLKHVSKEARKHKDRHGSRYNNHYYNSKPETVAKWQSWRDALVELMEKAK